MPVWSGSSRQIKESFRTIAENLMNLEVNTIVKDDMMTARKAPAPAHALLDIANGYAHKLTGAREAGGLGLTILEAEKVEGPDGTSWEARDRAPGRPTVTPQTFFNLYITARLASDPARKTTPWELTDSQKTVLRRIRKSSVEIGYTLERVAERADRGWAFGMTRTRINEAAGKPETAGRPDVALTEWEWFQIRKIWEVGTEEIVMQTVIQLDGDVVTRINKTYAVEKYTHLWNAHMDGARVAMDSWRFLVETIGRFVSAAVRFVKAT